MVYLGKSSVRLRLPPPLQKEAFLVLGLLFQRSYQRSGLRIFYVQPSRFLRKLQQEKATLLASVGDCLL